DKEKLDEGDFRNFVPRLQDENYEHNKKLVQGLQEVARQKGIELPKLCLAWVLARGDNIVPIPGTTKISHLLDNIKAADIKLSTQDMADIEEAFPRSAVKGERYPEAGMAGIGG
ncbi:MAG: aldo/keto reductase, partial [Syntrophomonas sp.]